jgi:hypothetical protein
MELSRQAGDQEAEGRACVAFAECQQQLGQLADAVESLETYLELSRSQVGCVIGSAIACKHWLDKDLLLSPRHIVQYAACNRCSCCSQVRRAAMCCRRC